jgi:hypothetical protein
VIGAGREEVEVASTDRGRDRSPDRVAGVLALGFVVLLLATELVLTLPDENADPATLVSFYTRNRGFVIILQVLGFVAAGLLAGYAWRLRRIDRPISIAGLVTAGCALVPGLITLGIAVVADPAHPAAAVRWNHREPLGDDLLFAGIALFGATIAIRLARRLIGLAALAGLTALAALVRLLLAAIGVPRGPLDAAAPLLFVALVAVMGVLSWIGRLGPAPAAEAAGEQTPTPTG